MKKSQFFTLLILLFSSFIAICQNTAESLTSSLYDTAIWDEDHVTVVGGNSLLSSEVQGDSWTRLAINLVDSYKSVIEVETVDSQIGVAIGAQGTIWRTVNKGMSWTQIPSLTGNEEFLKLQFIDGVGYIAGRKRIGVSIMFTTFLYKSMDLGASWQKVPSNIEDFGGFNPSIHMYFITATKGYLNTNNGGQRFTIDGGITWQQNSTLPSNVDVRSMQFMDENIGYVYANTTGSTAVHRTSNGGNTWSSLDFTEYSKCFKVQGTKIYYGDYAGGSDGMKMAEVDGSSQQATPIFQQGYINNIEFVNDNVGYVVGRTKSFLSSHGRFIFKTTDGGNSWVPVDDSSHLEENGNDMRYLNKTSPNTYVRSDYNAVAGDSRFHIVHSYDNGSSWQVTRTYNTGGEITYANEDFICHVRYFNPFNSGEGVIISESNDGGLTFSESPVITEFPASSFYFWQQVSEDTIFIDFGQSVYYSNDQGITWGQRSAPNGIIEFHTQFISDNIGYLYGENPTTEVPELYKTENGGQSWVFLFDIPTHSFSYANDAFDFSDENRIILLPRYPTGTGFLYDLNTSVLNEITVPNYINKVKSVNSSSYVIMTNQDGTHYTPNNGTSYTKLNFRVDGAESTVPPFFVEPDESITFYDYGFITRVKVTSPNAPEFLVGSEVVDVGTTTTYFLSQDHYAETEWELLSGGGLILDPDFEDYEVSVIWTEPGTHTLRARRTSDFGNSDYVDIQVTANGESDTTAPIVNTQDITVFLDGNGAISIEPLDIDNGSTDNLTPTNLLVFELDVYSFFCDDIGTNEVTLTVTDLSGNSASETATVTVVDNLIPTVITQNITIALNGNSSVSIVPEDVDNDSSDNCLIESLELDIDTFTTVGDHLVTLTATDDSNNTNGETAIVTVIETLGNIDNTNFSLTISPNPTEGSLRVISTIPYMNVQIIDLSGRLIASYDYQEIYDLSMLNSALYIMVFNLYSGDSIQKMIIKK